MPRYNRKQKAIREIKESCKNFDEDLDQKIFDLEELALFDDRDTEIYNDMIDRYSLFIDHNKVEEDIVEDIISYKYLYKGKNAIPKLVTKENKLEFLENIGEDGFLKEIRMSKTSFNKLYNMVKDHAFYQSPATSKQIDVKLQLAIILEQLRSSGNDAAFSRIARRSGVGKGSIRNFILRFFSVMMSMEEDFIFWSLEFEKQTIMKENEKPLGFPNLIGFLDGLYCGNILADCDHNRKIRYLSTGYFGSSRDMRAIIKSSLRTNSERYFSKEQYVLADSRYKATNYVVPVCKKPRNQPMHKSNEKFNVYIAMMHVKIEYAFGILKERFYSLKSIPVQIKSEDDIRLVNSWIQACIILNNFLMDQVDDMMTIRIKSKWEALEFEEMRRLEEE
ncbi:hypothetical protein PHYBLDRAFT_144978 [Phycomyces blakesleeanus NRRL 1555(-)]|uniref:DDE Tnp4 domain-containing protein n=1 Tax=Phycomyces blakesleeanus (strain ATCC 8743b / DSM 1359 / FGSC 10004 / NBRC 33097 / NRRL 1555) TaxID=763407 RepID=A0A163AML2_PHYB8|nr:hypothetical protein PHYBLDRAFT_144978 [Phycomyces blakesleeanus NRRL 1555(-)]OAD74541.1 hypothetical protein PHYBLDRAFT_144978 [Phycomyces blakesleeanus NRRL 1555(-)]|eukprot:XP_018292581.1 hypothetical protein PHYBLDRAFT_144978 [Phycomyces blakesleeanus NRRL 1555(-)]